MTIRQAKCAISSATVLALLRIKGIIWLAWLDKGCVSRSNGLSHVYSGMFEMKNHRRKCQQQKKKFFLLWLLERWQKTMTISNCCYFAQCVKGQCCFDDCCFSNNGHFGHSFRRCKLAFRLLAFHLLSFGGIRCFTECRGSELALTSCFCCLAMFTARMKISAYRWEENPPQVILLISDKKLRNLFVK